MPEGLKFAVNAFTALSYSPCAKVHLADTQVCAARASIELPHLLEGRERLVVALLQQERTPEVVVSGVKRCLQTNGFSRSLRRTFPIWKPLPGRYKQLQTLYKPLRWLGLPSQQRRSDVPSPIVLCIDDRSHLLELRRTTLESVGYSVKAASGVTTAIKLLEETPVAVVLLEYKLEGLDAEAVAFHIKQRFPELPIVLLSAFSEMPERILWLVDEYVMKSEPLEGLVRVIGRLTRSGNSAEGHNLAPASDGCCHSRQSAA